MRRYNIFYLFLFTFLLPFATTTRSLAKPHSDSVTLITPPNLSTQAAHSATILRKYNELEASDLAEILETISEKCQDYYDNTQRYFGFKVMYWVYGNSIENLINKYTESFAQLPSKIKDVHEVSYADKLLNNHITKWKSVHAMYAHYKGHFL